MATSVEITNKDGKKFRFQTAECPSGTYALNTKLFKQALPGETSENAIVINLGRETDLDFVMELRNTPGEDASNGTQSGGVYTLQEKVDYLLDVFITAGLQDAYFVTITTTNVTRSGINCTVEALSFNFMGEKPNVLPGSFKFSVGGANQ